MPVSVYDICSAFFCTLREFVLSVQSCSRSSEWRLCRFVWYICAFFFARLSGLHYGGQHNNMYQNDLMQVLFFMQTFHDNIYMHVCAHRGTYVMCFEFYRQFVRTRVSSIFTLFPSLSLSLFLPGPPVVVMGRDLSAHLMQLMFACAWGHEHRDTHSPDTHSAPLSPSVTTLSHSLSSASLPLLPSLSHSPSPPCIPRPLPAPSPTLHCTQSLNIILLCFTSQHEALQALFFYNHLHLPYNLCALFNSNWPLNFKITELVFLK